MIDWYVASAAAFTLGLADRPDDWLHVNTSCPQIPFPLSSSAPCSNCYLANVAKYSGDKRLGSEKPRTTADPCYPF